MLVRREQPRARQLDASAARRCLSMPGGTPAAAELCPPCPPPICRAPVAPPTPQPHPTCSLPQPPSTPGWPAPAAAPSHWWSGTCARHCPRTSSKKCKPRGPRRPTTPRPPRPVPPLPYLPRHIPWLRSGYRPAPAPASCSAVHPGPPASGSWQLTRCATAVASASAGTRCSRSTDTSIAGWSGASSAPTKRCPLRSPSARAPPLLLGATACRSAWQARGCAGLLHHAAALRRGFAGLARVVPSIILFWQPPDIARRGTPGAFQMCLNMFQEGTTLEKDLRQLTSFFFCVSRTAPARGRHR